MPEGLLRLLPGAARYRSPRPKPSRWRDLSMRCPSRGGQRSAPPSRRRSSGCAKPGSMPVYMQRDPDMTRAAAMAAVRRYADAGPGLSVSGRRRLRHLCGASLRLPAISGDVAAGALHGAARQSGAAGQRRRRRSRPQCCRSPSNSPDQAQYTVPLVLALEYAREHRDTLERTCDARTAFGQVMGTLRDGGWIQPRVLGIEATGARSTRPAPSTAREIRRSLPPASGCSVFAARL